MTVYSEPRERVLFSKVRDANPFFHVMESAWMLAGRQDLAFVQNFVARMSQYSDDQKTLHGAYGYRWRSLFGMDQLKWVIEELRDNPASRRAVLTMWSPADDIPKVQAGGKDVPCNTQVYFSVSGGFLDMTVTCRSNDIIWGAYGANYVHFSFLMEYIADMIGATVGKFYQLSNNYHLYLEHYPYSKLMKIQMDLRTGPSVYPAVTRRRLVENKTSFDEEIRSFCTEIEKEKFSPKNNWFVFQVLEPMFQVWKEYQKGLCREALKLCDNIVADDWKQACREWLIRRMENVG